MVDYKDLFKKISEAYADAPFFLEEVEFKHLPEALELCQVLENEPNGLTLEEINRRTPETIFSDGGLEVFEEKGVIEKGVMITGIEFADRMEDVSYGETKYFLCQDEK